MIHWVKTMPPAKGDLTGYRPFIRNDWFRRHYMVFTYSLMAVLTVLAFLTCRCGEISLLMRYLLPVAVFLVHELLHILVVYRIGELYMTHSGIYFWLQSDAKMRKGRYWVFMSLPLIMLTFVPAMALLWVSGPARQYLEYIAWANAIIAGSDIINSVLILLKPRDSVFYWGYYRTGACREAE